ncbi:MAG: hypothetical protein MEP44_00305 [Blastomonas sp.]|nr:hypothetical protein [Blastomonas sp.]
MIQYLAALALTAQDFSYAPFILQQEDAVYVNEQLDLKTCKIDKNRYSRWYWFDALAPGDGTHVIYLHTIRFVFVDDKKGKVVAMAYPPFDTMKVKTVAQGTYQFVGEKTDILCYE